jgi:thiamine transport system ATP-binding protein
MTMLRLEQVRAGYDDTDVLHDIDLVVPAGQLLCVLGPSGGGKSTLLRVIAGLETSRTGRIVLDERDLGEVPPHERGIGLMFQDYALFPHRDVGANVGFGLRMQAMDEVSMWTRVVELLEMVGLPGAERRSVATLSGGEQQRVALARALAPEPRLLMLDEPMGSLDRSLRERLPGELRDLFVRLGLTVVYVTHDQDEALSVADRVVLLDGGRIVADDTPEALWTAPPTAWAARFLGARNVAPGRITGGRVHTQWGALTIDPDIGAAGGEEVTVVVRSSAIALASGGSIRGRVSSRRFGGDHVLLTIAVEREGAQPLFVEARGLSLPAVGDAVELDIEPAGVHVIRGARALPSEA